MSIPQVPASAGTVASFESANASAADTKSKYRKGGRIGAAEGGGTSGQNERRREIREHLAEQFYKGQRNPQLRFKGPEELAVEYGVDEKTIRNDIRYLHDREMLPVVFMRARDGYGFTEEVKAFAGNEFTRGEYLALWLSVQSFEAWGGLPQQKKMPGILRKLKSTAAAMDPEQLKRMRSCITFKAGGFQAPVEQGIFDTVLRALLGREELTFGYVSLTRRREILAGAAGCEGRDVGYAMVAKAEARRVQPLHLLCWEYAWYLFAWDHDRADIRTFALGRMSDVELTGVHFEPEVKFNLRKELAKSFGITRGGKAVHVHLRYEKRAIPLVIERLWHPSQEMIENEDGTLDLTMHVAVTPELVRWVQSWGADVQVLTPVSLDDTVLGEARRLLEAAARRRGIQQSGVAGGAAGETLAQD